MRPNAPELLQGIQRSLMTYVLPEVQSDHVRMELMLTNVMLGVAAREWDGAVQRLVDENAALRALAGRSATALDGVRDAAGFASELGTLASESDSSLRLSDLSAANAKLMSALGRLAVITPGSALLAAVRSELADTLRAASEAHSLSLIGPRADG